MKGLAAAPRGRIVRQDDGNHVLLVDGQMLGAPGASGSRERTLANIAAAKNGVVVLLGLGAGHALREIRAHSSARILAHEPDPGLLRTLLEWGPCDLGVIAICTDLVDLRMQWASARTSRPEVTLVCTPGYKRMFPEAEAALGATVQSLIANPHERKHHYLRAHPWISDIIANLPHLVGVTTFLALEVATRDVPAFIVGAGRRWKRTSSSEGAPKKGIVFAANTSARALAKNHVTPQVVACLESIDLSADLRELPFIDEVVRAFSITGSPAHMTVGNGPLLPHLRSDPACLTLVDLSAIRVSPSAPA